MNEAGFGKILDCLRNARTQLDVARGEIECRLDGMAHEGESPTVSQIASIAREIDDALGQLWIAASESYDERDAEVAEPRPMPKLVGPNGEVVQTSPVCGEHDTYVVRLGYTPQDEQES